MTYLILANKISFFKLCAESVRILTAMVTTVWYQDVGGPMEISQHVVQAW